MNKETDLEHWQKQLQEDFDNGLIAEQEVREQIAAMRRALDLPVPQERQQAA